MDAPNDTLIWTICHSRSDSLYLKEGGGEPKDPNDNTEIILLGKGRFKPKKEKTEKGLREKI